MAVAIGAGNVHSQGYGLPKRRPARIGRRIRRRTETPYVGHVHRQEWARCGRRVPSGRREGTALSLLAVDHGGGHAAEASSVGGAET